MKKARYTLIAVFLTVGFVSLMAVPADNSDNWALMFIASKLLAAVNFFCAGVFMRHQERRDGE